MSLQLRFCAVAFAFGATWLPASQAAAQYAVEVVSYAPGTTPAAGFTDLSAPLGQPERFTGEGSFPGVVSPFSPPFQSNEIISIGEGGSLTLRLSNFVLPQTGPEIGIFSNVGLIDTDFPNGQASSTAGTFASPDSAQVEVSENGIDWESLGTTIFENPTNGYTDLTNPFSSTPGSSLADFQQPFTGSLSDFENLAYSPGILGLLAGSGGGTWLDISGTSLTQVGYLRFSVADDGDLMTGLNFELDAVSIATGAVGAATVPEPMTLVLLGIAGVLGFLRMLREGKVSS